MIRAWAARGASANTMSLCSGRSSGTCRSKLPGWGTAAPGFKERCTRVLGSNGTENSLSGAGTGLAAFAHNTASTVKLAQDTRRRLVENPAVAWNGCLGRGTESCCGPFLESRSDLFQLLQKLRWRHLGFR